MNIEINNQYRLREISEMVHPLLQQLPQMLGGIDLHMEMVKLLKQQPEKWRVELAGKLDYFLKIMKELEASDLDLGGDGCRGTFWYRVYGSKNPIATTHRLNNRETDLLLLNILKPQQQQELFSQKNHDFSYTIPEEMELDQRYRGDMYYEMEHLALNMRRIDNIVRPFKELELHPEVAKALSLKYYQYGLTLITGITGSGKSSTLDTIIDANNRSMEAQIVIVASPVELVHKPVKSVVRHREVGRDVPTFKDGAVQALRQDPDIIMIGELRDPETIMTAIEITDSGHKTFSTLHTSSATESIERIIGEMSAEQQDRVRSRLADVLTCVISQKLIPSIDNKRVLAKEVLLITPSVKAAIKNNNLGEIYQMLMEGSKYGMHTMEQDLKRLYDLGKISRETAVNHSNNKKRMKTLLNLQEVGTLNRKVG